MFNKILLNNKFVLLSMYIYKTFSLLKQDRADESAVTTEQKRRKDDERGTYIYFNVIDVFLNLFLY